MAVPGFCPFRLVSHCETVIFARVPPHEHANHTRPRTLPHTLPIPTTIRKIPQDAISSAAPNFSNKELNVSGSRPAPPNSPDYTRKTDCMHSSMTSPQLLHDGCAFRCNHQIYMAPVPGAVLSADQVLFFQIIDALSAAVW